MASSSEYTKPKLLKTLTRESSRALLKSYDAWSEDVRQRRELGEHVANASKLWTFLDEAVRDVIAESIDKRDSTKLTDGEIKKYLGDRYKWIPDSLTLKKAEQLVAARLSQDIGISDVRDQLLDLRVQFRRICNELHLGDIFSKTDAGRQVQSQLLIDSLRPETLRERVIDHLTLNGDYKQLLKSVPNVEETISTYGEQLAKFFTPNPNAKNRRTCSQLRQERYQRQHSEFSSQSFRPRRSLTDDENGYRRPSRSRSRDRDWPRESSWRSRSQSPNDRRGYGYDRRRGHDRRDRSSSRDRGNNDRRGRSPFREYRGRPRERSGSRDRSYNRSDRSNSRDRDSSEQPKSASF